MSKVNWKKEVFAVLEGQDLETMTKKKVRSLLAEKFDEKLVKASKEDIKKYTQEYVDKYGPDQSEEEEEAEESKQRPTKKQKTKQKSKEEDEDGDPRLRPFEMINAAGEDAPKNLKKAQANAMKTSYFMKHAERLEIDLWGNKMSGPPRTFSSNGKGWYTGGKALVKVGKKKVWAQVGVNVSILGSKEWND